ncbi:MAG TPA: 7-carboxy-7-deazaguanine synthase QueE [Gemmatimonadetes bacterium]|nr:7-carboxy-7-deazaguanine synthase QueE [Gemmatimonadota bacterium]|tara:strand:+ start:44629 stop:45312 length:684 start_codon:yes stop_codon:yes gene_type:complete
MSGTDTDQLFIRVTEIFHSVQGESTWAGLPCTFVRLTGCPLRCVWCDTTYAFHKGERRTITDVIDQVGDIGTRLVEVTGGEPLAHPNALILVTQLADAGHTVLVETSGTCDVAPLDPRAHKIMDLKCPGSGESHRNLWTNLDHLGSGDEIKFVVKDREDWEWTARTIRERGLDEMVWTGRLGALLVSPVWEEMDPEALAEWTLASGLPVRFQMQLHKLIWGAERKGV